MIYELKRYVPHDGKADALQERFAARTMPIFKRLGMEVTHCWTVPEEAGVFYYMLRFRDQAHSDQAWAAFAADPEWKQVKAASEQNGALLAGQSTVHLVPTRFSPDQHG